MTGLFIFLKLIFFPYITTHVVFFIDARKEAKKKYRMKFIPPEPGGTEGTTEVKVFNKYYNEGEKIGEIAFRQRQNTANHSFN